MTPGGYRRAKCGGPASKFRVTCGHKVKDLVPKYNRVKPGEHLHEIEVYRSTFVLMKKVKRYSYMLLASRPSDETDDGESDG